MSFVENSQITIHCLLLFWFISKLRSASARARKIWFLSSFVNETADSRKCHVINNEGPHSQPASFETRTLPCVTWPKYISALAEKVQDKQDWKVCKIFSVWLPQKFEKNSHEIREFEYNFSVSTSIGQSPRKIPRLQFNGESENFASTRKKTFGRHWWTNSSWNDLYANSLGHEFTPKGQNWWQN